MGRLSWGIFILLAIFALGLWNAGYVSERAEELEALLSRSVDCAKNGDEEAAQKLLEQAERDWGKLYARAKLILPHSGLDAIEEGFCAYASALSYGGEAAAAGERLIFRISAVAESEKLSPGSLF